MSLSTSDADGRHHRARTPMRKLQALGLSKDEVVALYYQVQEHRAQKHEAHDNGLEPAEQPAARLSEAREYIRRLIRLGFAVVDIADQCALSPSTLTKVLDPLEGRVLSVEKVETLREVVNNAGRRRLMDLLPALTIRVLETCCDKAAAVDPVSDDTLANRAREALMDVLLGVPTANHMTPGIAAVLLALGEPEDGVRVIVAPRTADTQIGRLMQLKALEHEAKHVVRDCETEREAIERELGRTIEHQTPKAHA